CITHHRGVRRMCRLPSVVWGVRRDECAFLISSSNAPATPGIATLSLHDALPICKPEAIHEIHDRFALDERLTVERYLRAVNYGFETTGPDRSLIVGSTAFPRETYLWLKCPLRASSLVIMTNRFANSGNDVNWSRRWHK